MHEFELINNFFSKLSKDNKSSLELNDDVYVLYSNSHIYSFLNIEFHFLNVHTFLFNNLMEKNI